ncbi:Response regulatory domain-containing protein [Rubrivivax sp. A210]|uniref:response regulator n=1 Tax=Rubrivivax sp. A210 TaxID=2772301 RepID=UPI00191B6431|nr:response regulator [Rubrivivax sp. A210]CAD5372800.1 Response regulatory domain-containing protein [Rubrivivax sp. A210]
MSAQQQQLLSRVLVVDDDPVVGKSFDRVLSGKGYAVVTARDGEEALAKIGAEKYDAVFTDIRMPGMDGITVAERIRAQQPWLPVVIVSGYATVENEARARAAGVSAVLHKPLSPQMIEDSAREAVRERGVEAVAVAEAPAVVALMAVPAAAAAPAAKPALRGVPVALVPLLTLAFVLLAPFAGLLALVAVPAWHFVKWLIARPSTEFTRWGRDVALFFAAPFLGLAYIIAMPFVGLGVIAWFAVKAVFTRRGA